MPAAAPSPSPTRRAAPRSADWVGRRAPAFSLPDQDGTIHRLADYKGRVVVLFWYPKDDTTDCTKEACGFRDARAELAAAGAVVLGASTGDVASKKAFADRHALAYPLLADPDHRVAAKYGVWLEKSMYGRKYWGIVRQTFVIDAKGKVAAHWPRAKGSADHAGEVLACLRELAAGA